MESIKQAITRIGRSVRQLESMDLGSPTIIRGPTLAKVEKSSRKPVQLPKDMHIDYHVDKNIAARDLDKYKKLVANYQKNTFRDFLIPLGIEGLKSFEDKREGYDFERAQVNWNNKKSDDRIISFENFLQDRHLFNKMLDILVLLTPSHLMRIDNNDDYDTLQRILKKEDDESKLSKFPTPKYHYQEIPPMPSVLNKENFKKYIYFLTHLKILYKNSSSMSSGLVPDLLLYTHKLTNTEFKPFRSVETYNYLIKYFGSDKNQSKFARELILVMNKDGHSPNTETINVLLRSCRIHSNIRSVQSTYSIIIKYLKLMQSLKLQANLTTWNRIYDCIHNIFLKEVMINKISTIRLPISKNTSLRIISDYIQTTKDNQEVIQFIEKDLKINDWRNDSSVLNKVIIHEISQLKLNEDLKVVLEKLISSKDYNIDGSTVCSILESIQKNSNFDHKIYLLLMTYMKFNHYIDNFIDNSKIFEVMIFEVCLNSNKLDYANMANIVRYLIHYEAKLKLNLPSEVVQILPDNSQPEAIINDSDELKKSINRKFKHITSKERRSPEHYKIIKRLTGFIIDNFEGKLIHYQSQVPKLEKQKIKLLDVELTTDEIDHWLSIKKCLLEYQEENSYTPTQPNHEIVQILGLKKSLINVSNKVAANYTNYQFRKIGNAVNRDRLYKLEKGFDSHTMAEAKQRNILPL